jgi:hypothetical protein
VLLALFFLILLLSDWFWQKHIYHRKLTANAELLRKLLFRLARMQNIPESTDEFKYAILGIADHNGGVWLILELPSKTCVCMNSVLEVLVSASEEVWGIVRVTEVVGNKAWAEPIDRCNKEFWEALEDRMKTDPSPPRAVHLEPHVDFQLYDGTILQGAKNG